VSAGPESAAAIIERMTARACAGLPPSILWRGRRWGLERSVLPAYRAPGAERVMLAAMARSLLAAGAATIESEGERAA